MPAHVLWQRGEIHVSQTFNHKYLMLLTIFIREKKEQQILIKLAWHPRNYCHHECQ